MKYRLLRDCPHGKVGSVWDENGVHSEVSDGKNNWRIRLEDANDNPTWFPKSTFSDWFEEIKEMKKFTKEQAEEIRKRFDEIRCAKNQADLSRNYDWLNANTESV